MRRRPLLWIGVRVALAVIITAAALYVVGTRIDFTDLRGGVARVGAARWSLATAVVCVTMMLRAARLCLCLGERMGVALVSASIVHNALVAVLPAKLGEFALPALLARLRGTEPVRGLGVLIVLRIFDLLALGTVGALACSLAYRAQPSWVVACFIAASLTCATGLALLARYAGAVRSLQVADPGRARAVLARLLSAAATLEPADGARLAVLSVTIWISLFTSFFIVAGGAFPGSSWAEVAVLGTGGSLAFALPVSGVANVGPFQAGWVAAGATLGIPADAALLSSLLAHGVVLITTLLLGVGAGLVILLREPARR